MALLSGLLDHYGRRRRADGGSLKQRIRFISAERNQAILVGKNCEKQ